ncbi:DUF6284 family protein [Micromonospora sp. WMMD1274]|uniref:DUF6284 family protein n=1 Tax=Micromonospora sp. WMMD1274 TaxID=3404116 RepID=UPI003B92B101
MTSFQPFPAPDPTADDLAAIEGEIPLIEAEVLLLDAQIAIVTNDGHPSDLDWQRIRRAQRRVLREARALIDSSRTDRAA